jgi:hypothetical protein
MFDFIRRMSLRGRAERAAAEENPRLRSELSELRSKLNERDGQISDLLSQLASRTESPQQSGHEAALWVPPGHFYSPLVDPTDGAVQRAVKLEESPTVPLDVFGIDEERLLYWFDIAAEHYAREPFPEHAIDGARYYYCNPNFPLADALALLAFMQKLQPRHFVEIGSGYSSCAAIDINNRYLDGAAEFTFIDPHPELALRLIGPDSPHRNCFLQSKLQDVPTDLFRRLGHNDILFIDSSHVAKTGSDVVDYVFRVLPNLHPGVLIHIHDIFYPFEYPQAWITDENRSWNEAYLVRAYLHGNNSVRVLYMSDWFYKCRRSMVQARMPLCIEHRGGSLWLQTARQATAAEPGQREDGTSTGSLRT